MSFLPGIRKRRQRRSTAIRKVIDSVIQQRAEGVALSDSAVERLHPRLMPELGSMLNDLATLERAAARADEEADAPDDSVDNPDAYNFDLRALRESLTGYEILERIHSGGQGIVYRAMQRSTRRIVALKVLLHGVFATKRQRERFVREIELVSKLKHPNIVTLHESGVVNERHYFVMECIDGVPIDDYVLWHRTPIGQRVRLIVAVARAMEEAHKRGIIHRDLKPSNILVDDGGVPHVLDFGLAKDVSNEAEGEDISHQGHVIGTIPYLSPEQVSCMVGDVDVRSDVYALGVVLFKLVTGQHPYPVDGDALNAQNNILHHEPAKLRYAAEQAGSTAIVRDIKNDLESVVRMALEKEPRGRYQSMSVFADDLERCLAGEAVTAKATHRAYTFFKTLRRFRIPLAIAAVFLIMLGAASARIVQLLIDRDTLAATGDFRVKSERSYNVGLLNRLQRHEGFSRVIEQMMDQRPNDPWSVQAERLVHRREVPVEEFERLLGGKPKELLASMRSPDHPMYAEGKRWLDDRRAALDAVAVGLEHQAYWFPTEAERGFAISDPSQGKATFLAAEAGVVFVARAFDSCRRGDAEGVLENINAAFRLATDLGDAISLGSKSQAQELFNRIQAMMAIAIVRSLQLDEATEAYVRWVLRLPEYPSVRNAIHHESLRLIQVANDSFRTDADGNNEYLDLDAMNRNTNRFFESFGALTDENRRNARRITIADVRRDVNRFVTEVAAWDNMTLAELRTASHQNLVLMARERARNPFLLLIPVLDAGYESRLMARAKRRALRLVARAIDSRNQTGAWPEQVKNIVPPEAQRDLIDCVTGKEFEYAIVNDMPRIRSTQLDAAVGSAFLKRHTAESALMTDSATARVTYFPVKIAP